MSDEAINLSEELRGLVLNLNNLLLSISSIRQHVDTSIAHIPGASSRLEKISGETESATHKLIDTVDVLNENDALFETKLDELKAVCTNLPDPRALLSIEEELRANSTKMKEHHLKILELLQFQDLTSQQTSFVTIMLNKIEAELMAISSVFNGGNTRRVKEADISELQSSAAVDPNATFIVGGADQDNVDAIIDQFRQSKVND